MTTKMFLLAVLGSNIFWIGVALFSLIGSALTMKRVAPVTYMWLTKGEDEAEKLGHRGTECFDKPLSILLTLIHIFFWWLFVIGWLCTLLATNGWALLGIMFRGIFTCVDKIIPDVSIKVERKK